MSKREMEDIYYAFVRARREGFNWVCACVIVAERFGVSERKVRQTVIQHGLYNE